MSTARNSFDRLIAPLIARAERRAKSVGERRLRTMRADGSAWRKAALLWPSFTKRTR